MYAGVYLSYPKTKLCMCNCFFIMVCILKIHGRKNVYLLHLYNTKLKPTTETQHRKIYDSCKSPSSDLIHFYELSLLSYCVFFTPVFARNSIKSSFGLSCFI